MGIIYTIDNVVADIRGATGTVQITAMIGDKGVVPNAGIGIVVVEATTFNGDILINDVVTNIRRIALLSGRYHHHWQRPYCGISHCH